MCAIVWMGWDGMGTTGPTARRASEIDLTTGRKKSRTEQDAVGWHGRRWEQRSRSGRGRNVAGGNKIYSRFPFPS